MSQLIDWVVGQVFIELGSVYDISIKLTSLENHSNDGKMDLARAHNHLYECHYHRYLPSVTIANVNANVVTITIIIIITIIAISNAIAIARTEYS